MWMIFRTSLYWIGVPLNRQQLSWKENEQSAYTSTKNRLPEMRISWNLGATELWEVFFSEYARSKDPILDLGSDLRETLTSPAESANNHLSNEAPSASLKFVSWYTNFFSDGETAQSKFSSCELSRKNISLLYLNKGDVCMNFLTDSFIYLMETLLCLSYQSSCKLYRADNSECSGSKWLCSLRPKTVH